MLRKRLGNERFLKVLSDLRKQYQFRAAGAADLLDLAKKSLPPGVSAESMEGFFDNWVYSTGIPTLRMKYSVKGKAPSWKVSGTVEQSAVDDEFLGRYSGGDSVRKRRDADVWVRTSNESVPFSATLKQPPVRADVPAGVSVLASRK